MPEERFRTAGSHIVADVIDGEAIIMDLSKGSYFSILGSGAEMWLLLAAGASLAEAEGGVARHYGIDPAAAGSDLRQLASRLVEEDLLRPAEDGAAPATATALGPPPVAPYAAPTLNKYGDMKDLLAFDPPIPEFSEIPGA